MYNHVNNSSNDNNEKPKKAVTVEGTRTVLLLHVVRDATLYQNAV